MKGSYLHVTDSLTSSGYEISLDAPGGAQVFAAMADESSSSPAGSNAAVQSHLGDEDGVSDRRRRIEELVERAGPISAHKHALLFFEVEYMVRIIRK